MTRDCPLIITRCSPYASAMVALIVCVFLCLSCGTADDVPLADASEVAPGNPPMPKPVMTEQEEASDSFISTQTEEDVAGSDSMVGEDDIDSDSMHAGMDNAACIASDEDGDDVSTCDPVPDCDDTDETVSPLADEICDDGIDQDCNGSDMPCECEAAEQVTPCDGRDDDCDGSFDECETNLETCVGERCLGRAGARCSGQDECAPGLWCSPQLGACGPLPTGGTCDVDVPCPAEQTCSLLAAACNDSEPRCRSALGGTCQGACDCTGDWLCRLSTRSCVECTVNAQCDDESTCMGGGFCAAPVAISQENGNASLLGQLLISIANCWSENGNTPRGCGQLALENGTSISREAWEAMTCELGTWPAGLGLNAEQVDTILYLKGCLRDARNRISWTISITSAENLCLNYLTPRIQYSINDPRSWRRVAIMPCDAELQSWADEEE